VNRAASYRSGRTPAPAAPVLLAFLLASGIFAAPWVAGLYDFGHQHLDHAPEHVHEIDATLRNPILSEGITHVLRFLLPVTTVPLPANEQPVVPPAVDADRIRAPPAFPAPF
jgi:hypothetical protein